jgi:hypothetical protein
MFILSSPASLSALGNKKTGPSRFRPDFLTELTKLSKFRIYKRAYNQLLQIQGWQYYFLSKRMTSDERIGVTSCTVRLLFPKSAAPSSTAIG